MTLKNYRLKNQDIMKIMLVALFLLTNCTVPKFAKPSKVDTNTPVNAKEKARRNVEEGRGISLKGIVGGARGGGTTYQFGTSNALWRASLDVLDFMPLSTVDYSGGIIITDWYNDTGSPDESIKLTVRFLNNEIQSNSVKVIVHNKKCKVNLNCQINEIDSKIKYELQRSILKKAALLEAKNKKK